MTAIRHDRDQRQLDTAATLLDEVGRSDPATGSTGLRIHCLSAVQHLLVAGAQPRPEPVSGTDHSATIRQALRELAQLPAAVFAEHHIVEAAADAQLALERSDDG